MNLKKMKEEAFSITIITNDKETLDHVKQNFKNAKVERRDKI
jgi:hypothetical protein